jgi:hypothetical protein
VRQGSGQPNLHRPPNSRPEPQMHPQLPDVVSNPNSHRSPAYRPPPQGPPVNVQPRNGTGPDQMPEIRKYKKRFNSEINCASLWGVNLLIGTNNGLLLLDRSGQVRI